MAISNRIPKTSMGRAGNTLSGNLRGVGPKVLRSSAQGVMASDRPRIRIVSIDVMYRIARDKYGPYLQGLLVVSYVIENNSDGSGPTPDRSPSIPDRAPAPHHPRPRGPREPVPSDGTVPVRAANPRIEAQIRRDLDDLPPAVRDAVRGVDVRYIDGLGDGHENIHGQTPRFDQDIHGRSPITIEPADYANNPRNGRQTVWHEAFHAYAIQQILPAMNLAKEGKALSPQERRLAQIGQELRSTYLQGVEVISREISRAQAKMPYMKAPELANLVDRLWNDVGHKYFPSRYAYNAAVQDVFEGTDDSQTVGFMEYIAEAFACSYNPANPRAPFRSSVSPFLNRVTDLIAQLIDYPRSRSQAA